MGYNILIFKQVLQVIFQLKIAEQQGYDVQRFGSYKNRRFSWISMSFELWYALTTSPVRQKASKTYS